METGVKEGARVKIIEILFLRQVVKEVDGTYERVGGGERKRLKTALCDVCADFMNASLCT